MKIIEKMARDEIFKIYNTKATGFAIPPHLMPTYGLFMDGGNRYLLSTIYEAGFRAAREMAAEIANRKESDTDYQITRMGESEVE